jgi:recombinational DNA repair protein RecR
MDFDESVIELSEADLLETVSDAENGVQECSCCHLGPEHSFCSICSTNNPNVVYQKNERYLYPVT